MINQVIAQMCQAKGGVEDANLDRRPNGVEL